MRHEAGAEAADAGADPRALRGSEGVEEPRRTRRSRIGAVYSAFDVPERLKRPGWAYSFFPVSIYNEPVEATMQMMVDEGGWEPVPAAQMPGYPHAGYQGTNIEFGGQRLYMRPDYLERESRAEDIARARAQSEGRLQQARVEDPRAPNVQTMQTADETFVRPGAPGRDLASMEAEAYAARESARAARANQDAFRDGLRVSADDVSPAEREQIAAQIRAGRGKF